VPGQVFFVLCGEWLDEGRIGTIIFVGFAIIADVKQLMCDGGPGQVVFGCLEYGWERGGSVQLFLCGWRFRTNPSM
jgi:hypothetical protein